MKRLLLSFAMASLLLAAAPAASASPDITDLLKGAASKIGGGDGSTALSGLKGAVEGMIAKSDLTAADLVGDYKYSAPAVSLQSDNALQKLGGSAATGVIVDKLAPYYQKAGLTSMTATFREDGTCEFKVKKATVTGTYERNESGDFTFNFKAVKKIPLGKMNAHVEKSAKTHPDVRCLETYQTRQRCGKRKRPVVASGCRQDAQQLRRALRRFRTDTCRINGIRLHLI